MNILETHLFKDPNAHFGDIWSMHSMAELYAIQLITQTFKPERIVEYGTGLGGVTRLFGRCVVAEKMDCKVLTIEDGTYCRADNFPELRKLINNNELPIQFLYGNEYWQEVYTQVQEFIEDKKTLFYCDGGNKPLEMRWCAALLKPGDLLLVHDFEIGDKSGVTLNPLLGEIAYVARHQVERVKETYGLRVVLEELLGSYDLDWPERPTRILALKKKVEDLDGISGVSETQGS